MSTEVEYQTKDRNVAVPTVYLMLVRWDGSMIDKSRHDRGEILLSLRQDTGYQDGQWETPAGHVDDDELPSEAILREAQEEVGVIVLPSDIKQVHTSYRPRHDKTGNRVDFIFLAENWTGEPRVCEPDKCAEVRWFPFEALPKNMVPHVREFIRCWDHNIPFSEFDIDWLVEHDLWNLWRLL